nr:MAG TPA: RNA polymerase Rpb5-like protein [Caudoviricetes sp.]
MTVNQIKQLASDRGYSLTATNKAGIISEFLSKQG